MCVFVYVCGGGGGEGADGNISERIQVAVDKGVPEEGTGPVLGWLQQSLGKLLCQPQEGPRPRSPLDNLGNSHPEVN